MSERTHIGWTGATWNPWHGCHKVSPGCKYCYMFRDKRRYGQRPDVVVRSKTTFTDPLGWREPKLIFTCSWSDWFIEEADAWRAEAYDVIRQTPRHTYQILTKRPERIAGHWPEWPAPALPNVWLGVSVESPAYLRRITTLRAMPAALRFLSLEPLLSDLGTLDLRGIGWVIAGGESGPGARAMHPDWVRSIRDQCVAAGVPFFFKQWGAWRPWETQHSTRTLIHLTGNGMVEPQLSAGRSASSEPLVRIAAGKPETDLLDGRAWREFPVIHGR